MSRVQSGGYVQANKVGAAAAVCRQSAAVTRYEQTYNDQQVVVGPSGRASQMGRNSTEQAYYTAGPVSGPQARQLNGPPTPATAQVRHRQQPLTSGQPQMGALEQQQHHHGGNSVVHHHHQPAAHLLGNPTPPLTPTAPVNAGFLPTRPPVMGAAQQQHQQQVAPDTHQW